jgi:hypothetical protein
MRAHASTAPPISFGRVPTRDLVLKIHMDDGAFHRLDESGFETACGMRVDLRLGHQTLNERQHAYPLAAKCHCWTDREVQRAHDAHESKFSNTEEP